RAATLHVDVKGTVSRTVGTAMGVQTLEKPELPVIDNAGHCRICGDVLTHTFVDLGMSPLCESYLTRGNLDKMEPYYPLHVMVCGSCFLVQLKEYVSPNDIFTEYAYFSSYSSSWVDHAKTYCRMI